MAKKTILLLIIISILIMPTGYAAEIEGGEDVNPESDDVPFTITYRDTPSVDKDEWKLAIEMNEDAHNNGTTFEIITQICLNDGVCEPPVIMDAEMDGRLHTVSLTPPNEHSYVNWRIKATDSEGNKTNYPQGDWYKTWSSCWYNDGQWGGSDSTSDGCEEETPGFGIIATTSAIAIAAISISRKRISNNSK